MATTDPARQQLQLMWRVAGMAMMLSAEVAAGAAIGWLVDLKLGTAPNGLVIGGIVGIVVGMTTFLRSAWRVSKSLTPPTVTPDRSDDDRE